MAVPPLRNALIFSKTAGYRHESIPTAISAITNLLQDSFNVTASEDAEAHFTTSNLSGLDVVILLHTSGDFLTTEQLSALEAHVHRGGGVFAIHGAASGMTSSSWYGKLIGAHFDMHPPPERGTLLLADPSHPILSTHLPPEHWMDEWYNFKTHPAQNENLHILLRGDTTSFNGGRHGEDHPLVWCQEFEGGRSAYVALGHFEDAYSEEWFMGVVRRGVGWVAGRK